MSWSSFPHRAFARIAAICAAQAVDANGDGAASVALPAAIRTRRPGVPQAAQPVPEPLRPDGMLDTAPTTAAPPPPGGKGEAHAFLALEHVDLSIDVLRRHLDAEPRPMPAAWVMLLDLCRTHGRAQAFREIAAAFHLRCNVCAPSWGDYPPDRREPGLEAYPRLVRELTQAWGTHECRRLLDRLLYDNRSGGRRGFTMSAYNDLIALRRAAGAVLDTIEQDFAEESKVREAHAQAVADAIDEPPLAAVAPPLVHELESQLDADLAAPSRPSLAAD